jgi:hypothetical protein
MGDTIAAIIVALIAWLIYLLPTVLLLLPLWYFGRKRARFMWWELNVLVVPFAMWLVGFLLSSKDKSLGNVVEVFILTGAVTIAALIRIVIGAKLNRNFVSASLMLLICVVAVLLGIMFPEVPFHWFH